MFQIREGVFETNSSSTHCIVVTTDHGNASPLEPDSDHLIEVSLDEFSWGPECFSDLYRKLQYVLTMIYATEYRIELDIEIRGGNLTKEDRYKFHEDIFKDTFGFMQVNDLIQEYCGYGIKPIVNNIDDVYIDHQSCEDYSSLGDFLDAHDITLDKLLFDTGVYILVSNDNGGPNVQDFSELQGKVEKATPSWGLDPSDYDDDDEDWDDEDISFHDHEGKFEDTDAEEFPDYYDEEED